MAPRANRPQVNRNGKAGPEQKPRPGEGLSDPGHVVVEPIEGAAQAFAAGLAGAFSAILPLLGNLFRKDGSLSPAAVFGLTIFALLVGWGILQALGRARQRKVFWEAGKGGLTVHMDNIGPLQWRQIRAIEPVRAGPGWLTGSPVTGFKVYPWMPMDIRRRMRPDPEVKFLVRRPVMEKDKRFIRLPLWQTKMREHGEEIAARLQEWHAGSASR